MELPGGESEVKFLERNLTSETDGAAADPASRGLGAAYAAGGYGAAAGNRYNRKGGGRGRARGRGSYR